MENALSRDRSRECVLEEEPVEALEFLALRALEAELVCIDAQIDAGKPR